MKSNFVSSAWLSTSLLVAILSLVSMRIPAQDTNPPKGTKTMTGNAFEGEMMDSDCAQMGSHETTMKANSLATPDLCTMYCLHFKKTPGKYVLYNSATKMTYQLDDQNQASFFGGRKVKVTGTYEAATKTIHVSDITSVS
jgi:hypothetical protein